MPRRKHKRHHKHQKNNTTSSKSQKICINFLNNRCSNTDCRFVHPDLFGCGTVLENLSPNNATPSKPKTPKSRHLKAYNASQLKKATKQNLKDTSTDIPHSSGICNVLFDDNLLETFYFLSVLDLGTICTTCTQWNLLQSTHKGGFGTSLWSRTFASLFASPSSQWRRCIQSIQKSGKTTTTLSKTSWKNQVQQRTMEQHQWLKKAQYDYTIHKFDRQILHVGVNQEFQLLEAAVNAAAAFDTIVIHPGDYSDEIVRIRKSIEIVAAVGAVSPRTSDTFVVEQAVAQDVQDVQVSGSPISITDTPIESNPIFASARRCSTTTFLATLGKIYIYPGAKVRFHNVAFGGDDSVVSFDGQNAFEKFAFLQTRKTFIQFDACSFKNTLFVYEKAMKSAKLDVRLHRCIVVSCDSVLMGNGGGPATIRPFGLDLEHLDDEVDDDEEQGTSLASFHDCFGLP